MADVLEVMGVAVKAVTTLKDEPFENGNWLIETCDREAIVLRRYHDRATAEDLVYEHAVLRHLSGLGWVVPVPLGDLVHHDGSWFCLTRFVPGGPVRDEAPAQRRRRGRDLARLDAALHDLVEHLGQRPGWRAHHEGSSPLVDIDWDAGLVALAAVDRSLAARAASAATAVREELETIGARDLPLTVVHGDFAEWNVHYDERGRLAGVIDFGLTHLDSRPYELAIARTHRSTETVEAYAKQLERLGWPLSDLERAAIAPIHRAFRIGMVAWELEHGRRTGAFDVPTIERQLRWVQ